MNVKIQKWGNSLALRIPSALARESRLSQGCAVDLKVVDGNIVVEPQQPPEYDLAGLLAKVTKKNVHDEVSTGQPVGKETM